MCSELSTRLAVTLLAIATIFGGCQQAPAPNEPGTEPPAQPTPSPAPDPADPPNVPDAGDDANPNPENPDAPDLPGGDMPDPDDPGDGTPEPDEPADDVPEPQDPADPNEPAAEPKDARVGIWRRSAGSVFTYHGPRDGFELTYLEIGSNGSIELTLREPPTNILSCQDGSYTFMEEGSMIMQVAEPEIVQVALADQNTLSVTDFFGEVASFARESARPDDSRCREFELLQRSEDLVELPYYYGGVAFDGATLRYNTYNDTIEEFDPVIKQAYSSEPRPSSHGIIHAAQGETYWYACACDSEILAVRRTRNNVVLDEIHTSELGMPDVELQTLSIAYDPVERAVWLYVEDDLGAERKFLKVNAESEPDVLIRTEAFEGEFASMDHDGDFIWAVDQDGEAIVQLDTSPFQAVATWRPPNREDHVRSLAVDGHRFHVLASTADSSRGVHLELARDGAAENPGEPEAPEPFATTGVWELVAGAILVDPAGRSPDIMVIREDGSVEVVYASEETGAIMCFEGTATTSNGELALHFDEIQGVQNVTALKFIEMPEAHTLRLIDGSGQQSTFARRRSLPERYACRSFTELDRLTLSAMPEPDTGLASDGDSLWYSPTPVVAYAVQPSTGAVSSNGFGQDVAVHGFEGLGFWTLTRSIPSYALYLVAGFLEFNEVVINDTDLTALALDSSSKTLWLSGRHNGAGENRLFSADVGEFPAVVMSEQPFDAPLRAMTFDGRYLWGVTTTTGGLVLKIDPAQAKVIATYADPDPAIDWLGISLVAADASQADTGTSPVGSDASLVDFNIFLIGRAPASQKGVLVRLIP